MSANSTGSLTKASGLLLFHQVITELKKTGSICSLSVLYDIPAALNKKVYQVGTIPIFSHLILSPKSPATLSSYGRNPDTTR